MFIAEGLAGVVGFSNVQETPPSFVTMIFSVCTPVKTTA
jgi:hypothetical protein